MAVFNFTPHDYTQVSSEAFEGLTKKGFGFVASAFDGSVVRVIKSSGELRIKEEITDSQPIEKIPVSQKSYSEVVLLVDGKSVGLDSLDINADDTLIVSLPTFMAAKAMGHAWFSQMVVPDKVVRDAVNGSLIYGAMGLAR